ncbi:hypothetical protein C0992_000742 [Termitomyces sp. T32_za158]|nr:hypothetical protein C0992_000742 [Termitomyces sp. T32_za158]
MVLGPRNVGQEHKSSHSLQHSTKLLISRYESMSNPHNQVASGTPLELSMSHASARSLREKSPMRRSLQSLFSALKKVNLRKGRPVERPLISYKKQHHLIFSDNLGLNAPPVLRSRSRKLTNSSDLKPIWLCCTATLEPGAIVITSLTHSGNSSVHVVELLNCTDVRSLSPQQLHPEENALLPRKGENDEFKVFEILFEGRPREKFAANSVQERAGWVSAVWDTVLPIQDQNGNRTSDNPQVLQPSKDVDDLATLSPAYDMRSRSLSQRVLPPIPRNQKPLTSALRAGNQASSSPVCFSIHPTIRPVSRASSERESRSTSPSIANLSQLSVVRQRLAQIEATPPRTSEGGLKSRTSPTSSVSSLWSELEPVTIHAMTRDQSGQSSAADSILDSYGDQSLKSPDLDLLPPLLSLPELETRNTSNSPAQARSVKRLSHNVSGSPSSPGFQPVMELLHGHTEKSCNNMNSLYEQVSSLRDDVHTLPRVIASTVDNGGRTNHVLKMVMKLEQQARLNRGILDSIHSKVDKLTEPVSPSAQDDSHTKVIRALHAEVTQGLSQVRTLLESKNEVETLVKMNNVAPSASQMEEDILNLNSKVNDLMGTCSDKQVLSVTNMTQLEKALADISSLIERGGENQGLQAQQQSETVRYLTELNSWLEAFINHDRVHNHNLSVKIDQICRDLSTEGGSTLVADIHQLAQSTATRDHGYAALQASLDGLLAMLNENSVEKNFSRLTTLIGHQCQHQEQLIRALGTGTCAYLEAIVNHKAILLFPEIFDEIKGERLRFVEAMKEATAINVQSKIETLLKSTPPDYSLVHVDQFKQELRREVLEMAEEVVHQDRQAMQNQIADLCAFYRKKEAAVENVGSFRDVIWR